MKRAVLLLLVVLFCGLDLFGQNNVEINFQHTLGTELFEMNKGAQNNLGNDFEVTRLQYYVSGISIVHDGGIITPMTDVHILVDAERTNQVDLGNHNITTVEMVKFSVGVHPDFNHLDPASYAVNHPLAPKNPSMHWGWDPGYRFVCFEGKGGTNYDQLFQLHGLGDANYLETSIEMEVVAEDNKVALYVSNDCSKMLNDIEVNSGVVVHGEDMEARKALMNMRDGTFTASGPLSSVVNLDGLKSFDIVPNPTYNGIAEVRINADLDGEYSLILSNILGQQLIEPVAAKGRVNLELDLPKNGMYIVTLLRDGLPLTSKKLIAK